MLDPTVKKTRRRLTPRPFKYPPTPEKVSSDVLLNLGSDTNNLHAISKEGKVHLGL